MPLESGCCLRVLMGLCALRTSIIVKRHSITHSPTTQARMVAGPQTHTRTQASSVRCATKADLHVSSVALLVATTPACSVATNNCKLRMYTCNLPFPPQRVPIIRLYTRCVSCCSKVHESLGEKPSKNQQQTLNPCRPKHP